MRSIRSVVTKSIAKITNWEFISAYKAIHLQYIITTIKNRFALKTYALITQSNCSYDLLYIGPTEAQLFVQRIL